jgi:glycosyltransferase involved in cell wall biosynthesis
MIGVRYISLHDSSGYATAGRRVMQGLIERGIPLTWTPMVLGMGWNLGYEPHRGRSIEGAGGLSAYCNAPVEYDTVIIHTVPEYFPRWKEELLRTGSPLLLGHTVWETTRLPQSWPELLNRMDGLLVPCSNNLKVFADAQLGLPIELLPHPCWSEGSTIERQRPAPDETFRFYSINTWTGRKAIDLTLRAYLRAFDRQQDVEFILKTSAADYTRPRSKIARPFYGRHHSVRSAVNRLIAEVPSAPKVTVMSQVLGDDELAALHAQCDAYISLSRCEGWGLGAFDAATFDNPVIMTGFGGQLDYLAPAHLQGAQGGHAHLVDHQLSHVVPYPGGELYTSDQQWAQPSIEHAVELMRKIRADPEAAHGKSRILGDDIRTRYGHKQITDDLLVTIERMRDARASRFAS